MTLSTICHSIVRFYFNCHHVEFSSLYLHSAFTRRLQFACRLVLTFLICAFLGYGTPLSSQLTNLFMIPNSGVLCIQETFGHTLSTALRILITIIPLSVILFTVQNLVVAYHNYLVGVVLILSSSFCISYICQKVNRDDFNFSFSIVFYML
jgi:hypothetical protein